MKFVAGSIFLSVLDFKNGAGGRGEDSRAEKKIFSVLQNCNDIANNVKSRSSWYQSLKKAADGVNFAD